MNQLTVAVAGGRKTQSIVDASVRPAASDLRILVLGYTQASQLELANRIRQDSPFLTNVEVSGWYAFLLRDFVRPYLPLQFPGHRLNGFNFDGEPIGGYRASGVSRFLDSDDHAFRVHLSKLAMDVLEASGGAVIDRLEHIYHEIYIDEVQDLCGSDLDVIEVLLKSKIEVRLVGDIRQAVLSTNVHDQRHKQFRFEKIMNWFRLKERAGMLQIVEQAVTFRSNQTIADFADSIFPASCGYSSTTSAAESDTGHDGIYTVALSDIDAYRKKFDPLCLRHSASSGKKLDLPFRTFGTAKGLTVDRVLVYPTKAIKEFLDNGTPMEGKSACGLYIAVTRARHSVAFILDTPRSKTITEWCSSD